MSVELMMPIGPPRILAWALVALSMVGLWTGPGASAARASGGADPELEHLVRQLEPEHRTLVNNLIQRLPESGRQPEVAALRKELQNYSMKTTKTLAPETRTRLVVAAIIVLIFLLAGIAPAYAALAPLRLAQFVWLGAAVATSYLGLSFISGRAGPKPEVQAISPYLELHDYLRTLEKRLDLEDRSGGAPARAPEAAPKIVATQRVTRSQPEASEVPRTASPETAAHPPAVPSGSGSGERDDPGFTRLERRSR